MTDQTTDIAQLLHQTEDLDPELEIFLEQVPVIGQVLRHPLVFCVPYHPQLNAWLNQSFSAKKEMVAKERACNDFAHVVFLHERPYRAGALSSLACEIESDETYWRLVRDVWVDSENIRECFSIWEELLSSPRPHRELMMDETEFAQLAELPELIEVFQGHTTARDDGWSFTTDEEVAVFFARRFAKLENSVPVVSRGLVRKNDVEAYFLSRGESEILCNPSSVAEKTTTFVD